MRLRKTVCGLSVLIAASATCAQPIGDVIWSLQIGGDAGDAVLNWAAGETTASFELWADIAPDVNGVDIIGYAGSIFDLMASGGSAFGTIVAQDPHGDGSPGVNEALDDQSATYILDENNSFLAIETFQLPPAFNGNFDPSDPILVMSFDWVWDPSFPVVTEIFYETTNRINMDVYQSAIGGSAAWEAIETRAGFLLIPAPASLAIFAFAGGIATRRRR